MKATVLKALHLILFTTPLIGAFHPVQAESSEALAPIFEANISAIIHASQADSSDAQSTLAQYIDFPSITRGVLGKHRDQLSGAQNTRFQAEFEKSMVTLLGVATQAAGAFTTHITQTKLSPKNSNRGQTYAEIKTDKGQVISLIASVAKSDERWLVRNLIFDGVNLGLTYRNQFDQLMQKHNGDAEAAINEWAQHAAQNRAD